MAQLLPSNLKDYDVLLAAQLGNISAAACDTAQTIATNAATLLLQNRSTDLSKVDVRFMFCLAVTSFAQF